jgi:hypothetical protein
MKASKIASLGILKHTTILPLIAHSEAPLYSGQMFVKDAVLIGYVLGLPLTMLIDFPSVSVFFAWQGRTKIRGFCNAGEETGGSG